MKIVFSFVENFLIFLLCLMILKFSGANGQKIAKKLGSLLKITCLIPISLQPDCVTFDFSNCRLFDLIEFIV